MKWISLRRFNRGINELWVKIKEKVALSQDILVSTNVGYLKQGQTLSSGTTFENIFRSMLSKELDVEGVAPKVYIHNDGAAAGNKEIGVEFSVDLSSEYVDGYFKAVNSWGPDQPAGCASGTSKYYKSNVEMAGNTDSHTFTSESSVNYKTTMTYGASTNIPKTNYGNDSSVRINAGTATSSAINFTGCYRYYYIVNTSTKLTASSTFAECAAACTNTGLLSGNVDVIGSTAIAIGDATHTKYVFVLIPVSKATPKFDNELGVSGTMIVLNDTLSHNGVTYKLCTTNPDGHAGDKYKNCKIIK